ncbi:MAG: replication initiation protein [Cetobacterium sp.]
MNDKLKYEMVEYSKDVATSINEFSAYELDIFLCLVYVSRSMLDNRKVSETENLKLELPASMIKKFLTGAHNSRVKKAIENIFDTKVYLKDDKYTKVRHLFEGLDYSSDYKTIDFELKKEYIKLFYNLSGNFTQHKIKEFTSLKSRYAKRIYQIIMSYKNLYKWQFDAVEFRKILDIPDSYGWSDIEVKLIRKIKIELQNNTNISEISLIKEKSGRNITKVTLKWKFSNPEILEETDFLEEPEEIIKKRM